jgi:hypothetical protein
MDGTTSTARSIHPGIFRSRPHDRQYLARSAITRSDGGTTGTHNLITADNAQACDATAGLGVEDFRHRSVWLPMCVEPIRIPPITTIR